MLWVKTKKAIGIKNKTNNRMLCLSTWREVHAEEVPPDRRGGSDAQPAEAAANWHGAPQTEQGDQRPDPGERAASDCTAALPQGEKQAGIEVKNTTETKTWGAQANALSFRVKRAIYFVSLSERAAWKRRPSMKQTRWSCGDSAQSTVSRYFMTRFRL